MINIKEDGSFIGTLEDAYREYASLITRRELKDKKDLDIAKETFETEQAGIVIDSVQVDGKDSINLPLKLKVWISSSSYAQSNGDLIYINPHILHRSRENPFKMPNRKFPIDYSYRRNYTNVVTLFLPNDFEVKEILPNRKYYINSDFVTYSRKVQIDSQKVQLMCKFEIRETEIKPQLYTQLRDLYSQIIAAESEQLVLSRIKKPAIPTKPTTPAPLPPKKKEKKK